MIKDTWEIFPKNSASNNNMLPVRWSFKCKSKTYWTISKFKVRYFVRGGVQGRTYIEPLNSYYPVLQWDKVRLIFIFRYILVLQSQSIDFANSFAQADIASEEPVFVRLSIDFNINGGHCDIVFRLKKIPIWYIQSYAPMV